MPPPHTHTHTVLQAAACAPGGPSSQQKSTDCCMDITTASAQRMHGLIVSMPGVLLTLCYSAGPSSHAGLVYNHKRGRRHHQACVQVSKTFAGMRSVLCILKLCAGRSDTSRSAWHCTDGIYGISLPGFAVCACALQYIQICIPWQRTGVLYCAALCIRC